MLKNNGFHNRHSPILRAFSPLSLFSGGAPGAWYDPSDYDATGTLFQDSAGTTPVTAVEQPVGLMLDKSQGLVASTKGGQMVGVSGSGFDTPSATANQITGDIDIRVQASLVSWTPAAINVFCSRLITGGNTADSYEFWISTSGVLQLLTVSGTTNTNVASSVAVGFAAGTTNWVRVTWQQSSGFVNFFTSSDGVTWTQNGTANRAGTTGATNAGSRLLRLGARVEGSFPLNGTIYKTQIYNGINGTLAVDFNPTLYTSGATYTAATGEVWTITGSNARIVPNGNHAFQATSASRPVLSARYNLLTKTEQFDDVVWVKSNATASGQRITANAGTFSVYAVQNSSSTPATSLKFSAIFPPTAGRYRYVWLGDRGVTPIASATFDLQAVSVIGQDPSVTATASTLPDGSVICSVTYTKATAGVSGLNIALAGPSYTSDRPSLTWAGSEFVDAKASFVVTNSLTSNAYQRVNTATDYATTGFLPYLKFDGVDDSLSTNSISFTATDKMSVFAGVRKLSAAVGVISELGSNFAVGSSFGLFCEGNPGAVNNYTLGSCGTAPQQAVAAPFVAPITNTVTGISSISGDVVTLRVNGVQISTNTGDQGTGNYGNYPLYIGRRNNAFLPLNGQIYSLIIVGKAVTAGELSSTETYVAAKTGVTLLVETFDFITTDSGDQIVTDAGDSVISDTYFA